MGAIVASRRLTVGGHELDERILTHLKREHRVLIGQQTAEQIKVQIASASLYGQHAAIEILGRYLGSESLQTVRLTSQDIRGALERPLAQIMEANKETLMRTPPQLACDVMDLGIMLTGGGSLLHGLVERLGRETGMPARLADSPSTCVATGASRLVESRSTRSRSSHRAIVAAPIPASR